jgi:hypothetical protein
MKRIFALLIAFLAGGTICFAQQAAVTHAQTQAVAVKAVEAKSVVGAVKSVVTGDPAKGTRSEIIVIDEKSVEHTFVIKGTTTVYDVDFKATGVDKIKANEKVKIKYSVKEGVNEATSITVVK